MTDCRSELAGAERAAAWEREDPDELRRAADEWESRAPKYAAALRAWANGDHSVSPATLRPHDG